MRNVRNAANAGKTLLQTATSTTASSAVLVTALLALCTFLLSRHTQVPGLSAWLAPIVLATVLITLRLRADSLILVPVLVYAAIAWVVALGKGIDAADAVRFLAIVCGVVLATQCVLRRVSLGWALAPVLVQAVLIIAISAWLGVVQDEQTSIATRAMAFDSQWGDIYSHNGWYYKVQVVGNALIPLAWMLSIELWRQGRWHWVWPVVLTLGLFAAGNLTYLIICGVYAVFRLAQSLKGRRRFGLVLALAIAIVAGASGTLIEDTVAEKFDGSDSSIGVRIDQFEVLSDAIASSPFKALFGHGIGARYPDGKARPYSQSQYIELQIFYITYQIGVFGLLLLLGTLALALRARMTGTGCVIFWAYVACSITNPYIFDTNQMVATMLLLAVFGRAPHGA